MFKPKGVKMSDFQDLVVTYFIVAGSGIAFIIGVSFIVRSFTGSME